MSETEQNQHIDSPKVSSKLKPTWAAIVAVLVIGLLVGYLAGAKFGLGTTDTITPTGAATIEKISVSADDEPIKGDADAPILLVEFSDFQCPYCAKFWTETLPTIATNYIDAGEVKMVHRDFPLGFHPLAISAAIASECADDEGKFWEMHDLLYGNQAMISDVAIKGWAAELELENFDACYDAKTHEAEVQADMADGAAAGVSGTPAFFVIAEKNSKNDKATKEVVFGLQDSVPEQYKYLYEYYYSEDGEYIVVRLVGAQKFDIFQQVIDAALTK